MREKLLFDKKWMFHRGDLNEEMPPIKRVAYISAKTERCHVGPASPNYYVTDGNLFATSKKEDKTEKWECVELPHDYMAGDEPDRSCNEALGFCHYDNAWYIKRFDMPAEDEGKQITLLFDGVATHATVYLNGCLMKHNFCGYTPFEVDVTDMLRYGEENSLAVYVNTQHHEGWWYEGAGKLYSTGSSVSDHTTIFCPTRKMWMGRIGLAVKLSEIGGICKVHAFSDGLLSATLNFEIDPVN